MESYPSSMNRRPRIFSVLDGQFWADPWISSHVLYAHLDSRSDDASRPLPTIEAEVAFACSQFRAPGKVLDLGCGPGLHGRLFSQRGWQVTGLDVSPASIEYARSESLDAGLNAAYFCGDFLSLPFPRQQDLILLAYGTLGTLSPRQARRLLDRCRRSLRPGGLLMFDLFRKPWWDRQQASLPAKDWDRVPGEGFWAQGEHLVLTRAYAYPLMRTFGRIYTVVEPNRVRQFPFWYRWYDPAHARAELLQDWHLEWLGSLRGTPLRSDSTWCAALARRPSSP